MIYFVFKPLISSHSSQLSLRRRPYPRAHRPAWWSSASARRSMIAFRCGLVSASARAR
jgi:hypothetical protein